MPPFVIEHGDLATLTQAVAQVVDRLTIEGDRCVPAIP
jgi:hypothetical protein